jgi:hypothetical protein
VKGFYSQVFWGLAYGATVGMVVGISSESMPQKAPAWLAWWYLALALGFALLAIQHAITGDKAWLIGIRVVLAIGFGALARMEFTSKKRTPKI